MPAPRTATDFVIDDILLETVNATGLLVMGGTRWVAGRLGRQPGISTETGWCCWTTSPTAFTGMPTIRPFMHGTTDKCVPGLARLGT